MSIFKKFLLLTILIFLLSYRGGYGQDLIVTSDGDSLNVEIVKINEESIYFYGNKNRKKVRLPKDQLKVFQYIFYSTVRKHFEFNPNQAKFRLALNGGLGVIQQQPNSDDSEFYKHYIRRLNNGWTYGGDLSYKIVKGIGAGFRVNQYSSKSRVNDVIYQFTGVPDSTAVGPLSDNIKITFAGPQLNYNFDLGTKFAALYASAAAGRLFYKNQFERIDPSSRENKLFGYHLGIGIDFKLQDYIMAGIELSGTMGLSKIETERGLEDISRINLAFGLRFTR